MEETRVPRENTDKLYHIMLYQVILAWVGFELTTLVVIGTDCIGSCKSNYHTITTMTVPLTYGKASQLAQGELFVWITQ